MPDLTKPTRPTHPTLLLPTCRQAFDLTGEPDRVRARYGQAQQFLLARRLVEAGVGVVTIHSLNGRNWDSHQGTFHFPRQTLPLYDQGVAALVDDIDERGLDRDVLVVIWGEMRRTPKVNNQERNRDHWWSAGFALVAGGGLPMSQVIGGTDRRAEQIVGNAYTPQNMLATIYRSWASIQLRHCPITPAGRFSCSTIPG